MAKSVKPNALAFAGDAQLIQSRVKNSLHNLVSAEWPATPVNKKTPRSSPEAIWSLIAEDSPVYLRLDDGLRQR